MMYAWMDALDGEDVDIRTWCKLWSRKSPEKRLPFQHSIHPRNWGKQKGASSNE